jgi:hypothetical protein
MIRKDVIKHAGFVKPEMQYREDHEWWLRLASFGAKFKCIRKPLTKLLLHSGNTELKYEDKSQMYFQKALREYQNPGPFTKKIAFVVPGVDTSSAIYVLVKHAMYLIEQGHDAFFINTDPLCGTQKAGTLDWVGTQTIQVVCLDNSEAHAYNLDAAIATHWSTAKRVISMEVPIRMYFVQSDERRFSNDPRYIRACNATYSMPFSSFFTEALWIQKWLKREFQKDAYYVPNGVDYSLFYAPARLRPTTKNMRVLLEGPIDIPWKGMQDSYDAVKDLHLDIWVISSIGKLPSSWQVDNFLGKVSLQQMTHAYHAVDIFLKLSRVEGFFGPPLEAMACGVAVVVGKETGYEEYIVNGTNALVVETGDVKAAKKAVAFLLTNHEYRRSLVANGLETAKKWSWKRSFLHLTAMLNNELPHYPSGWS